MQIDFKKLKREAKDIPNSEERRELLSDLNDLEASEKINELLKAELTTIEANKYQGRAFTIILMLTLAIIDGSYIYKTIANGIYSYTGKGSSKVIAVSMATEPAIFWLWLSIYILVFIILFLTFTYMTFGKPSIIKKLL